MRRGLMYRITGHYPVYRMRSSVTFTARWRGIVGAIWPVYRCAAGLAAVAGLGVYCESYGNDRAG
jgi:hypothetical protein